MHRHLKPENVLVTTDGHTNVSDFGIAAVAWRTPTGYAGRRAGRWTAATDEIGRPEIKPIILERPPAEPWPEFAHLHFNDALAYFTDAGSRS